MNEYFQPGSVPANNAPGSSAVIRGEFASVAAAFDKLPVMAGRAGEIVVINATGTGLTASGESFSSVVGLDTFQTLTNKTLSWADNTWVGFGTAATKDAGLGPDKVLLLGISGVVDIAAGGTGASTLGGAQTALGIDLKADKNNAVLTGAPVCPTPAPGDNSARIVNSHFVNQAVAAVGGATPSGNVPLMNGVAAAGTGVQVSRDDHVHPVDTSRAPASAGNAAGTSFTPSGNIAANNVQAALVELDAEKAPLASPVFTGDPRAPTVATSDNDTSIATTAFVQALLAQQPAAGMQPSNNVPLANGAAAPGTGVTGSRDDHVHPVDTSRAPASAATAGGTTFAPSGNIAATNVQAALVELDTEKAPLAGPSFTGTVTSAGDINLTGTGRRITGDFSNASAANRLMFQSNVVNGGTAIGAVPNGTGNQARFTSYNSSDVANSSIAEMICLPTEMRVQSNLVGTGSFLPITFHTGGLERLRIDQTTGNVLATSSALGYGAGAGGTVTQPTSKGTAVTLHKPCGQITMAPDSLAPGASEVFILFSSHISAGDLMLVNADNNANYRVECMYSALGGAGIKITNTIGSAVAEAVRINFAVLKGATS